MLVPLIILLQLYMRHSLLCIQPHWFSCYLNIPAMFSPQGICTYTFCLEYSFPRCLKFAHFFSRFFFFLTLSKMVNLDHSYSLFFSALFFSLAPFTTLLSLPPRVQSRKARVFFFFLLLYF